MNLVPIKVRILLSRGQNSYPDFNSLPAVEASGMDWTKYVDSVGPGWLYDKTSRHAQDTADSPQGQQWGALLVPPAFAEQALEQFPSLVFEMTEEEMEDFWENKAHVDTPIYRVDQPLVEALFARRAAGIAATQEELDALDPTKACPGVREHPLKRWRRAKADYNIAIQQVKRTASPLTRE